MQRKAIIWLCMLAAYVAGFWTVPLIFFWASSNAPTGPTTKLSWTPEKGWEARCVETNPAVTLPNAIVAGVVGNAELLDAQPLPTPGSP
ncbi:MAG: hypothetical protein AB1689_22165 [Thermodesulfobacteriota bacterium]